MKVQTPIQLRVERHEKVDQDTGKTKFWYDVMVKEGKVKYATGWKKQRQGVARRYLEQHVRSGEDIPGDVAEWMLDDLGMMSPTVYMTRWNSADEKMRAGMVAPAVQRLGYSMLMKAVAYKREQTPPPFKAAESQPSLEKHLSSA